MGNVAAGSKGQQELGTVLFHRGFPFWRGALALPVCPSVGSVCCSKTACHLFVLACLVSVLSLHIVSEPFSEETKAPKGSDLVDLPRGGGGEEKKKGLEAFPSLKLSSSLQSFQAELVQLLSLLNGLVLRQCQYKGTVWGRVHHPSQL